MNLYFGVGVELVEEVHDAVGLQRRRDDYHVLLVLSAVTAVRAAHLLALHPRVRQLLELHHTTATAANQHQQPRQPTSKSSRSPHDARHNRRTITRAKGDVSTHTHAHTFNGPLSGTTRVSRYQKDKTNLDSTEARDSEWQWHQLGHMQVYTLLQTDNHASTPPLSFLQAGCPSCRPTNSVKALKARCIKLWDITSLGSVEIVGFFDVAARLCAGEGPIAALVGGSSCHEPRY